MPLRISAELWTRGALFELRGDLDAVSAHDLVRRIEGARVSGHRDLVVDLTRVQHVDPAGLSRLLWCVRRAEAHGQVQLLARRSQLRRLLADTEYADLLVGPGGVRVPRPRGGSPAR